MVYKLTIVYTNDTCHWHAQEYYLPLGYKNVETWHLLLVCSKNIYPLHTKTQDYHLTYPIVLL